MNRIKKYGLVLEGGGLRGMFTAGILDVFMENQITFDGTIGVSSGALFGINYKSQQPLRAYRYNVECKNDKRYMSMRSWFKTGNFVNAKFSYDTIPNELYPFNYREFRNNPMEFYVVCTDISKGVPIYKKIDHADVDMKWLQATASLPVLSKPVEIRYSYYLDGGMTDSIPLAFMQRQGFSKNVVILTRPIGYKKTATKLGPLFELWYHDYPHVVKLMKERHIMYNNQVEYVLEQSKLGNTFVIAPKEELEIGRVELNEEKMQAIYMAGQSCCRQILPDLYKFLK